jgi:hypothetical protein
MNEFDDILGKPSPEDKPPKRTAGAKPPRKESPRTSEFVPPEGPKKTPQFKKLEDSLNEFLGLIPMTIAMTGDQELAVVVAARTPAMAEAWIDLAMRNNGVKRVLDKLVEGSAWGGVIISTTAVALPIAQRTGIYRGPDPFALMYPALSSDQAPAANPPRRENGNSPADNRRPSAGEGPISPVQDGVVNVAAVDRSTTLPDY